MDYFIVAFSNVLRILSQGVFFVFFARALGAEVFGVFSAVMALVVIFGPFVGFGSNNLIVKYRAREEYKVSFLYSNAVFLCFISYFFLIPFFLFLYWFLYGFSNDQFLILSLVLVTELVITKLIELNNQYFQAEGRNKRIGLNVTVFSILRMSAVGALLLLDVDDYRVWIIFYGATSLVSWFFSVFGVMFSFKDIDFKWFSGAIKESIHFSLGISSQGVYNDVDKLLLMKYSSPVLVGEYSAAYKIIDLAFSPLRAFYLIRYKGYFLDKSEEKNSLFRYMKKNLIISMLLGFSATCLIILLSPLIPLVLGDSYEASKIIVVWLAFIPFLRSIHYVLSDYLTGAGLQKVRSIIQVFFALISFVLGLKLIEDYSWKGAVFVTFATEIMLVLVLLGVIFKLRSGRGVV